MQTAISTIIRNGVKFDMKNWDKENFDPNKIADDVEKLLDILEERKIPYLVVGGIALLGHIEGRNTQDIDIIFSPTDIQRIPEISIDERDKNFARGKFEDLQVDFLFTENKIFKNVNINFKTEQTFGNRTIPCATVDGLIILKCYAMPSLYRQGDFERATLYEGDIENLARRYLMPNPAKKMQKLIKLLAPPILLKSDFDELKNLCNEIAQRVERQKTRFASPPQAQQKKTRRTTHKDGPEL